MDGKMEYIDIKKIKEDLEKTSSMGKIDLFNYYVLNSNSSLSDYLFYNKQIKKAFEEEFGGIGVNGKDGDWFKAMCRSIMKVTKENDDKILNKLLVYFDEIIENTTKNTNKIFVRENINIYYQHVMLKCLEKSAINDNSKTLKILLNRCDGEKNENGRVNSCIHAIGWWYEFTGNYRCN